MIYFFQTKSYNGGDQMVRKGPVEFKGKLNGLYLNCDPNESFDSIYNYLKIVLDERGSFYKGSRIIGIKGQTFNYKQKAQIETLIYDQYGIEVETLEELQLTKRQPIIEEVIVKEEVKAEVKTEVKEVVKVDVKAEIKNHSSLNVSDTHFVYGTMRSGKSVHFPGHVVVIGDVNPGAEIVAEGNIIVLGRMLGFVHAGSAGNDQAVIIASLLKPTQIRISTYISVPPSDDAPIHGNVPEKATVSHGEIRIEACH